MALFDLELKYISFDPIWPSSPDFGLNARAYYYLIYATASLSATVKIYGAILVSVPVVLPSVVSQ